MILFKSKCLIVVWYKGSFEFLTYYENDKYDSIGYESNYLQMSQNSKIYTKDYTYKACIKWLEEEVLNEK